MAKRVAFEWTIQREEKLVKLWHEPVSLAEIGEKVGGAAASTVSQKAHRMGLGARKHAQATHYRKHLVKT